MPQVSSQISFLSTGDLSTWIREIAQGVIRGRVFDDLELRHLVEVVTRCSLLLSDIYADGRVFDFLTDRRPLAGLIPTPDRTDSSEEEDMELLHRLRDTPDRVKAVADQCLYDVGLAGLENYRGVSLVDLGVRSYRLASEVLGLLAEDRRLKRFFLDNRWANLPLSEEKLFLLQCSENFPHYAEIFRNLKEITAESQPARKGKGSRVWRPDSSPAPPQPPPGTSDPQPVPPFAATESREDAPEDLSKAEREEQIFELERTVLVSHLDVEETRCSLRSVVVDQDSAVNEICDDLAVRAAGTHNRTRPAGYLFVGPTGVGKNHLIESLVGILESTWSIPIPVLLLEGPQFTYPSDINDLKGATRGFIRSDEEGMLSEFHRRSRLAPFSVLVVDEVEKAHPQLTRFFLSVLDRGTTTDNRGQLLKFADTLIVFTSNLGFSRLGSTGEPIGYHGPSLREARRLALHQEVRRVLSPEFLNRLRMIEFRQLSRESMERIFELEFGKIRDRFLQAQGLQIQVTRRARRELIVRGFSERYGARHLTSVLERHLTIPLSKLVLKDRVREPIPPSLLPYLRELRSGRRAGVLNTLEKQIRQFARGSLPYGCLRVDHGRGGFRYRPVGAD